MVAAGLRKPAGGAEGTVEGGGTVADRGNHVDRQPARAIPKRSHGRRPGADRDPRRGVGAGVPVADAAARVPVPRRARRPRLPVVDPRRRVRWDLDGERTAGRSGADRNAPGRPRPRRGRRARRAAIRTRAGDRTRGGRAGAGARANAPAWRLARCRCARRRVGDLPRRRVRVEPRVHRGVPGGGRGPRPSNPPRRARCRARPRRGRTDAPGVLRRRRDRARRHRPVDGAARGPVRLAHRRRTRRHRPRRRVRDLRRRARGRTDRTDSRRRRDLGRRVPSAYGTARGAPPVVPGPLPRQLAALLPVHDDGAGAHGGVPRTRVRAPVPVVVGARERGRPRARRDDRVVSAGPRADVRVLPAAVGRVRPRVARGGARRAGGSPGRSASCSSR